MYGSGYIHPLDYELDCIQTIATSTTLHRTLPTMRQFILSRDIEDDDWDPLFVIDYKCFKDSPEMAAFFPGGLGPTHRAANIKGLKIGVFGGPTERVYAKLSDSHSGVITSFISSQVWRGPLGPFDSGRPPPMQLPRIENKEDRAFFEWFWNSNLDTMYSLKELQAPIVYIQVLATDPEWQRRGAATILMNWILDFTAKEKIGRCVLHASPMTVDMGFYEKFGFSVIDKRTFVDKDRFPDRAGIPAVAMIKYF
jgi:GNAT superfamily N-acetyltransferase